LRWRVRRRTVSAAEPGPSTVACASYMHVQVTTHAKTLPQHVRTSHAILPHVLSLLRAKQQQASPGVMELRLMGVRMSGLRKVCRATRRLLSVHRAALRCRSMRRGRGGWGAASEGSGL